VLHDGVGLGRDLGDGKGVVGEWERIGIDEVDVVVAHQWLKLYYKRVQFMSGRYYDNGKLLIVYDK
jgi:hypothetical protein